MLGGSAASGTGVYLAVRRVRSDLIMNGAMTDKAIR